VSHTLRGQARNFGKDALVKSLLVVQMCMYVFVSCFTVCFVFSVLLSFFFVLIFCQSCLIFVSSVLASLPVIKRWNGMEWKL